MGKNILWVYKYYGNSFHFLLLALNMEYFQVRIDKRGNLL